MTNQNTIINANDLKRQYDLISTELEDAALRVLRSGYYVLGPEVKRFEEHFAQYLGMKHCVGVASGLDSLKMAFHLLDIKSGDEVIVCANAYIACIMGITVDGATPIFVEPDQYNNIDADLIEAKITQKTKAILAVHLFGQTCDMDKICQIAQKYGLYVVEDCAQSHGNTWHGKKAGTFSNIACFSFYPTKGLGAYGDGGAIVTNDDTIAERARVYRNYGSPRRYYNEVIGLNSRLDELQAALLEIKLSHLDEFNTQRRKVAEKYTQGIDNQYIEVPKVRPGADSSWHQFVIKCDYRDELKSYLEENGIFTIIHYPIPPHLSKAYAYLGHSRGDFPITERDADRVLSIPMFDGITDEEIERVTKTLNRFVPRKIGSSSEY